jgi:SEC-C motif domain protein
MRSRYSAYVLGLTEYLLQTWHPDTRPAALELEPTQWLGLTVKATARQDEDHATVEFVARSRGAGEGGGRAHRLHERSRFERLDGRWLYLDGEPDAGAALSGADASTARRPR